MMKYLMLVAVAVLSGCASTREEPTAEVLAIQDYIAVAELPEVDKIRTNRDSGIEKLRQELLGTPRRLPTGHRPDDLGSTPRRQLPEATHGHNPRLQDRTGFRGERGPDRGDSQPRRGADRRLMR